PTSKGERSSSDPVLAVKRDRTLTCAVKFGVDIVNNYGPKVPSALLPSQSNFSSLYPPHAHIHSPLVSADIINGLRIPFNIVETPRTTAESAC
ncbi:hypothetical protein WG66_002782, partial [Moniliophthora roreri]